MDPIVRRSTIGIASGLICGVALVATVHGLLFGVVLGVVIGTLYAIAVRPTPFAYAESIFTAGALAIPLWTVLSVIVFPTLAGVGPQWDSQGMRSLFPQFVGWVLYGAALGLVVQALSDVANQVLGPEPVPPVSTEAEKIRIVILGGGFAGMSTAENLEQEFGADISVSFTLVSEGNSLLFTPMLAEVAGSSLEPSHISTPLRTSLHRTDVVRARVTGVDIERRRVLVASLHGGDAKEIAYGHLVFALGAQSPTTSAMKTSAIRLSISKVCWMRSAFATTNSA